MSREKRCHTVKNGELTSQLNICHASVCLLSIVLSFLTSTFLSGIEKSSRLLKAINAPCDDEEFRMGLFDACLKEVCLYVSVLIAKYTTWKYM